MRRLLEFLSHFNWLAIPETAAGSVMQHKSMSLRILAGLDDYVFYVSLDSGRSGREIERLLARHGIKMWGKGFAHGELFFRVRKRDAARAAKVLQAHNIPLR